MSKHFKHLPCQRAQGDSHFTTTVTISLSQQQRSDAATNRTVEFFPLGDFNAKSHTGKHCWIKIMYYVCACGYGGVMFVEARPTWELVLYFHHVGVQGSNLDPQAQWQVPLPSEPPHYLGKILNYSHYFLKNTIQKLSEEVAACWQHRMRRGKTVAGVPWPNSNSDKSCDKMWL